MGLLIVLYMKASPCQFSPAWQLFWAARMAGRDSGLALHQEAVQWSTGLNLTSAPEGLCNNDTLSELLPAELSLSGYVKYEILLICCPQISFTALWKKCQILFQPLYRWLGWVPQQSSDSEQRLWLLGAKQNKAKQNRRCFKAAK